MKNKPNLVIIRGLPGQGKSTHAKNVFVPQGYKHFENDQYFMKNGHYEFDLHKVKDAANCCFNNTANELAAGNDVVVSNVFVTVKAVNRYKELAKKYNATFKVLRMTGNFKNVHNIPKNAFTNMKLNFKDYPGEELVDPI